MDLRYTPEELAFRDEVRAFMKASVPEVLRRKTFLGQRYSKAELVEWQGILNAKGWATPAWDLKWGGQDWTPIQHYLFKEELYLAFAPEPLSFNVNMVGPVLIAFGTEEQKKKFLPKVANLDYWFCQGFSEPGAGSDLAALKTRAVREGDEYVINGQKIWTSTAHHADWMFCLVRTDPNAPKKQMGITYLLIDMKTPGLTVRPIITLDGIHETNEVFFDNVRVPVANRIGEENKGWDYAKFLLGHERGGQARVGLSKARIQRAKEIAATLTGSNGRPLSEDPAWRAKAVAIEIELKALEITQMRVISNQGRHGDKPDPASSVLKVRGTELTQATTELLMDTGGPFSMGKDVDYLAGRTDTTFGPEWAPTAAPNYYLQRAASIYGGSNEIQKNIIAKTILGL